MVDPWVAPLHIPVFFALICSKPSLKIVVLIR